MICRIMEPVTYLRYYVIITAIFFTWSVYFYFKYKSGWNGGIKCGRSWTSLIVFHAVAEVETASAFQYVLSFHVSLYSGEHNSFEHPDILGIVVAHTWDGIRNRGLFLSVWQLLCIHFGPNACAFLFIFFSSQTYKMIHDFA